MIDGNEQRLERWRQRTDGLMLAVGVGSVPILALELIRDDLAHADRVFLWVVNITVAVLFTVDYFVELSLSSDKVGYVRNEKIGLAIMLSTIVALVPTVSLVGSARLVRLAPALRGLSVLLRLWASGGLAAREGRRIIRQNTLRVALAVTGLVWVTAAVAFRIAEGVGTFFDALWWSAATITTVGYGDIAPVTAVGRIAGVFAMVVGITSFGLLTASFAAFLSRNDE